MLLHVYGGQRLGPAQDPVVEAGKYVTLCGKTTTEEQRMSQEFRTGVGNSHNIS